MIKSKFLDNVFKRKVENLIKSDRFISEEKVQMTYDEVYNKLGDRKALVTPEVREKLLSELYKNKENAFIKRMFELIDSYFHKDDQEEQEFLRSVQRVYKKFCSRPENIVYSESEENHKLVEERDRKDKFIGSIINLTRKYNSKDDELLTEHIDELIHQYGSDDIIRFITKAGKLYGLLDYEIDSLRNALNGTIKNPYICRRNVALFSLYEDSKSNKYNDRIDPDDDGYINLDEYSYIVSQRGFRGNKNNPLTWIINSNLDTYLAFNSPNKSSPINVFEQWISEFYDQNSKKTATLEETEKSDTILSDSKSQIIINDNQEDEDKFYNIKKYSKKLSDLIQEENNDNAAVALISSEEVDEITKRLQDMLDAEDTTIAEQEKLLKKIDEQTPTDTSDDIINALIDKINDPDITISPNDILEELLTESDERKEDRKDRIMNTVCSLGVEICKLLGLEEKLQKEEVIKQLYLTVRNNSMNIREKNNFLIPQIAKQLGIDAVVYYKTTETDSNLNYGNKSVEPIVNILREYKLIDDTKYYLTKNFLKPDEIFIRASEFIELNSKDCTIEMKHILESTERFIRKAYKENNIPKAKTDETIKAVRQGIIKRSLFNKMVYNTNESNESWGLIQGTNKEIRLAPMSIYENCTNVINTEKSLQRVVNNGKSYIEDFILVYSEEEWFKSWIDNAVVNLDFDKAIADMTRKTGVVLNPNEKEFFRKEIFDKMHSIIVNASKVNYNAEEIIQARKNRMTLGEKVKYHTKSAKATITNGRSRVIKALSKKKNTDPGNTDYGDR